MCCEPVWKSRKISIYYFAGRPFVSRNAYLQEKGFTNPERTAHTNISKHDFSPQDVLLVLGVDRNFHKMPSLWESTKCLDAEHWESGDRIYAVLRSKASKKEQGAHRRDDNLTLYSLVLLETLVDKHQATKKRKLA